MKIKNILIASMLMLGLLPASAQNQGDTQYEYVFHPHWYVSANIGGQYTIGEVDFQKLLSPNAQIALGYDFTPYIGARLSVNGWQSKAGTEQTRYTSGAVMDPRMEWKWNYISPMVDLTVNLSNMIMGNYNPKRPFILSAFVGLGANFGFKNDEAWDNYNKYVLPNAGLYAEGFEPFRYIWGSKDGVDAAGNKIFVKDGNNQTLFNVHFGLIGDIRLSDKVALNLELQANTLSDRYNSKCAHNSDWYFNALAGLKFALGKGYETREKKDNVREVIVERIVEKQIPCPEVTPAPVPVPVQAKAEPLRRDVFFTINSTTIDAGEQHKVQELADYLKKNPNAKVQITGYADKGTGNAAINKRLAEKRAAVVLDVLVKQYGISRDRISVDSKGDTVQPFAEQVKNRVSICVAE